jgi:predicted transcriptional regulator
MNNNIKLTSEIVSAYVARNYVSPTDLSTIISNVYAGLTGIASSELRESAAETKPVPAISVRKSVTPDYIISLEDGSRFKSLKGHLRAKYNMTPNEYRERWSLPADYPMVAPNYAATRSLLARRMGLGNVRRKTSLHAAA